MRTRNLVLLLACATLAATFLAPVAASEPGGTCGWWPPNMWTRVDAFCADPYTGTWCLYWMDWPTYFCLPGH